MDRDLRHLNGKNACRHFFFGRITARSAGGPVGRRASADADLYRHHNRYAYQSVSSVPSAIGPPIGPPTSKSLRFIAIGQDIVSCRRLSSSRQCRARGASRRSMRAHCSRLQARSWMRHRKRTHPCAKCAYIDAQSESRSGVELTATTTRAGGSACVGCNLSTFRNLLGRYHCMIMIF